MKDSEPNSDVAERVSILIDHFSYSLYRNVCRSLFEKDKLLYSFLVCTRLMLATDKISSIELRFLLSGVGGVLTGKQPEKPSDWVPDRSWTEILQMAQMPSFADFPTVFVASLPEVIYNLCAWMLCMYVYMYT
jgi:dynein heavy chain